MRKNHTYRAYAYLRLSVEDTERYKLMHFYNDIDCWELYDLQEDPMEMHNIYGQPGTEEPALLHEFGVRNAHLGEDDGDQRHLKHTAEDDEHGQAEADVALDTGSGLDVVGALDAGAEELEHEGHHELVGEQHAHHKEGQTQQDDQLEEERLALFQAGLCKGVQKYA